MLLNSLQGGRLPVAPTGARLVRAFAALILLLAALAPLPPAAHALEAPIPLAPADGTTTTVANYPPLGIPDFEWNPVPGATLYRLQASQDPGFATKHEWTTPNPRYTPPEASKFPDGFWYWRVRVEQPSPAGPYSDAISFTKQWATPDNAPALVTPVEGATLEFFDAPDFSWQPVTGAATYRFQIATSPEGFASPRYSQLTLTTAHQPTAKLANGTYYWRVIPLDPANREGTPSTARRFVASYNRIPTLLGPEHNTTPSFTPAFRWSAVRGAEYYRLQYSTDPAFHAGVNSVDTRNTSYTPISELPNDVNYYWRVQTLSGASFSDWTATRQFRKQWYFQPELLAPVNTYQALSDPFFAWSPVPGAGSYRIEINCANSFPPSTRCGWTVNVANPFHSARPEGDKWLYPGYWFWRVTPVDGSSSLGQPSATSSFVYSVTTTAPQLIAPLPYYTPPTGTNPHEDRTVPYPAFIWHRVVYGGMQAGAYRIQVDDDPLFWSVDWTVETPNLSVAPAATAPFTPVVGRDYYWRVRALDRVGGLPLGDWSQRWRVHFDPAKGLAPTLDPAPTLLRPPHGAEFVETAPLLEWQPLTGATGYEIQISADPDFNRDVIETANTQYPVYAPRSWLPYGTYYWRVRESQTLRVSETRKVFTWSATWRFQVAAASRWQEFRTLGSPFNQSLIGLDPAGDMTNPNYDLSTLYAVQSKDYWYFGFHASEGATDVVYALYLDLDHADGTDTAGDPRGYNVAAIPAHRPEYALYVFQNSGYFNTDEIAIYRRTGNTWDAPQTLTQVGGSLYYSPTIRYLELQISNTAIGMEETTGSASAMLFSVPAAGGHAQDTVPSDPAVAYATPHFDPATTTLSRFTAVSERLTVAWPPTNAGGDPTIWPTVGPFLWHLPLETTWLFWYGYQFQISVDPLFTTVVWDYTMRFGAPGYAPPSHVHVDDIVGDNTYYWRVRPAYDHVLNPRNHRGAWSAPARFERQGFVPQNLQTSVTFATPTFSWDMAEGAQAYELQVDTDPSFGTLALWVTTTRTSYTPPGTLAQGTYYWRVRIRRVGGIANRWTDPQTFVLTLPQPAGLRHDPPGAVTRAPTLCWTPLVASADDTPVFAAYKYRLQTSADPTFTTPYDTTDTEQACWTPTKGYADGTYYWRVATMDGYSRLGDYSTPVTFTKQYLAPALVSPPPGSTLANTPTFAWLPVSGAAKYKLETSLYPTFSPVIESVTTNNTRYTPTRVYGLGQAYYWRVAMVDKDNKQGPFAESVLRMEYADLQVFKSGPAVAQPGETITYTITYANMGLGPADGVRVTDALPAGVTSSQTPVWDIGHVGPGTIGSVVLTATLNASLRSPVTLGSCGAVLVNVAQISAASPESDTVNNEGRASTTVVCPDLLLTKSGPAMAQPGETITYTLAYNNIGMVAATGVRISDTLPAGVTAAGPITWEVGMVNGGAIGTVVFTATVAADVACAAVLVNRARIAGNGGEANPANNSAQSTTVVACPDLALTKHGPATAPAGTTISFTLAYTNVGAAPATGVRISDTLPAGLTALGPLAWDVASLNPGEGGTIVCAAKLDAGLPVGTLLTNTATVTIAGREGSLTNNSAQVVMRVIRTGWVAYLPVVVR